MSQVTSYEDTRIGFVIITFIKIHKKILTKSLELKHTIQRIREMDSEIHEIESAIQDIMDEINSPILTISGISYRMGAMILAEIGDLSKFVLLTSFLPMRGFRHLLTNLDSLITVSHTWRNEDHDISVMHFLIAQSLSASGFSIRCLSCQKKSRGQILQCNYLSCCKEACASNLYIREIWAILPDGSLTYFEYHSTECHKTLFLSCIFGCISIHNIFSFCCLTFNS